ncbi:MAG: hypothetical protein ACK5QC_10850 [Bacteroidota bacterium]|jgi:hypothetical protein|nr:hypothetical protein [Bacteroidota bacterium]MCA6444431.1 hypothetical protein [Bacteroidota bacterium]
MKKTTFILSSVLLLGLTACKKDLTCECTVTNTSSTTNGTPNTLDPPRTTVSKMTDVTKKQANANCVSGENTANYTFSSGGQSFAVVDVTKFDCKIK